MKKFELFDKRFANIVLCFIIVCSLYFVPSYINIPVSYVIKNEDLSSLISTIIYTILLILVFYKVLKKEFIIFKNNFKKNLSSGFKWYFLGVCLLIIINLILTFKMGGISDNETGVRDYIFKTPFLAAISIIMIAPISEEIIFRKSVMNTTKNKWIGSTISGILFGLAHVISYVAGDFTKLLYLLPYAALGFVFAMMDYENKNTFTSIMYHCFHNSISFFLIISLYYFGA